MTRQNQLNMTSKLEFGRRDREALKGYAASFSFSLLLALPFLAACKSTTRQAELRSIPRPTVAQAREAPVAYSLAGNGPLITHPFANGMWDGIDLGDPSISLEAGQAQPTEPTYDGWTARVFGGVVGRFLLDDTVTFSDPTFGTVELDWDDTSFGLGVDVERRFSKLLGLDLALIYTNMDIDFHHSVGAGVQTDSLGVLSLMLALNFHVVNTKRVDFYLGPQVAYFYYLDDLSYDVPSLGTFDFKTDNEFPSLGFVIGTDISLNDDWALNFALRYQDADADSNHDLPLDPTYITFGVSKSF